MKIYITNEDFSRMAANLYQQLLPIKDKFEYIVGIERGGLPLSNWLSYVLDKKHTSIKISFYGDGDKKNTEVWAGPFCPIFEDVPYLVVDDIIDTGSTIKYFKENAWHGFHKQKRNTFWVATLHWCQENSPDCKPDFYVETKKKDDWIIYPWQEPGTF